MFVREAWYVACTADALHEAPLGRTICDERIALFRDGTGAAVAIEDFCPHRGAPLSLGRVRDGRLVCGYHGLEMSGEGRPAHMPGQRVDRFPCVRRFPVIERYGFVWVWPGEASAADPAALPAFPFLEDPAWAYGGGLYHVRADYRLMIDNLMDLTHETYVHASSIGQPEIDETPCETRLEGGTVVTERRIAGIKAPPFWRAAMQANGLDPDADVDRWQICRFTPPSHVMIEVGVALAGRGGIDAPADAKVRAVVVDFITPETGSSHWYHWGMARSFRVGDAALTESIREGQGRIFGEDLEMLECQQRNLESNPGRRLLTLNIDAGGAHARRMIERLVRREPAAA